jgi:thioredoxin-dependent peroxiredoxin
MSKKTRKKSSKGSSTNSAPKASPAKAARSGSKASVKTPAAKARKTVAKKAGKAAKTVMAKASHKPASKPLKSGLSAAPKPEPKEISREIPKAVAKAAPKADSRPVATSGLVEGGKAPGFRLPRDGGDSVALADYAGQKLVLFFYPRADTPGCTREAIDFTRLKGAFADNGAAVLGVSADTVKAQESFRNKHQLTVPLVSDEKHEMLEAYGAWGEKSMYGRTFLGILRTTVLIGANGKIAKIWRNVRVDGHADEVLAAVQAM